MKKLKMNISVCVGLITLFLLAGPVQAVPVQLELSNPNVGVGDSFEIRVMAVDVMAFGPILGFGFDVVYDPAQFSWNGATVNSPSFLDTTGSYPFTDVLGLAPVPAAPPPGETDLLLATLGFTALSGGNHFLGTHSADAPAIDAFYEGIFIQPFPSPPLAFDVPGVPLENQNRFHLNSSIAVNVASVPEPATMLLLATGLLGVARFRRKFRP